MPRVGSGTTLADSLGNASNAGGAGKSPSGDFFSARFLGGEGAVLRRMVCNGGGQWSVASDYFFNILSIP